MDTILLDKYLKYIALTGNIAYVLWILVNGIDEGFQSTPVQIGSYIGLVLLLLLNTVLLFAKDKPSQ